MKSFQLTHALAVLVAGVLLALASPAHAQGLPEAEAAFARGQIAFTAKDYDAAAAAFQEAYAIRPIATLQFNTAVSYHRKGEALSNPDAYQLAIDFYGRYLVASQDASEKPAIDKIIDVLRAEIATLKAAPVGTPPPTASAAVTGLGELSTRGLVVIESNPASASIYLDDVAKGVFARTPWSGSLPEGEHKLIIEIRGYETKEVTITAAPDRMVAKAIDLAIGKSISSLGVTSNVVGALVYLDDKARGSIGPTPLQRNLPPGKHTVFVSADGYDDFVQDIDVKPGENRTLDAQLTGAPVGYLTISGEGIQRATIYIDGKIACAQGPCKKGVREGKRTVTATRPGYKPYSRKLEVKAGNETTIKIAFAPEPGRLDAVLTYVLSAAIAGGGVGLYLHSQNLQDDIDAETAAGNPPPDDDKRRDQTKYFKYGAYGAFGLAGITLLTAVYYTFRDKGPASSARVDSQQVADRPKLSARIKAGIRPELAPGYGGVGLALAW